MADMAHNLTAPLFPLAAYEDESAFKLYLSDIGLLTALYGFDMKTAVVDGTLKGSVKGGLYENLVASMLVRRGHPLRYLRDAHDPLEVEFLLEKDGDGILYTLTRTDNISVLSISNYLDFKNLINSRVTSSLNDKEIVFPPYGANQLSDILNERAQLSFNDGVLDSDVIPLCSAMAAK
jgi:predicted AAA+ superfamily ATPase